MAAGDEATLRYGSSCSNDQLLRQYGFTLHGNISDRLPLPGEAEGAAMHAGRWCAAVGLLLSLNTSAPALALQVGELRVQPHLQPAALSGSNQAA